MNEQDTTNQDSNVSKQKKEYKKALSTQELKTLLSGWLSAVEEEKDFKFEVAGHSGYIPKDILLSNTTKGEFELKNGEYEFELELKWREKSEKVQ